LESGKCTTTEKGNPKMPGAKRKIQTRIIMNIAAASGVIKEDKHEEIQCRK
jgi:hypothetical protein